LVKTVILIIIYSYFKYTENKRKKENYHTVHRNSIMCVMADPRSNYISVTYVTLNFDLESSFSIRPYLPAMQQTLWVGGRVHISGTGDVG